MKTSSGQLSIYLLLMLSLLSCGAKNNSMINNTMKLEKNGMSVCWKFSESEVDFEMKAPTNGWVAIGFNSSESITGTYWVMGRLVNKKTEAVEHFTVSPGNYPRITELGYDVSVKNVSGEESENLTVIRFTLPQQAAHKFSRELKPGSTLIMHIAYSLDDDFKHHSVMRTFQSIQL